MNSREKMLLGMNEIIMHMNDELLQHPWLMCGVPDGADDEEVMEMANDPDDFEYCVSLFLDIMSNKSATRNGIYINDKVITKDSRKVD